MKKAMVLFLWEATLARHASHKASCIEHGNHGKLTRHTAEEAVCIHGGHTCIYATRRIKVEGRAEQAWELFDTYLNPS